MIEAMWNAVESTAAQGIDPDEVAKRIAHALTAQKPATRYLIGRDARIRLTASKILPTRTLDKLTRRMLKLDG